MNYQNEILTFDGTIRPTGAVQVHMARYAGELAGTQNYKELIIHTEQTHPSTQKTTIANAKINPSVAITPITMYCMGLPWLKSRARLFSLCTPKNAANVLPNIANIDNFFSGLSIIAPPITGQDDSSYTTKPPRCSINVIISAKP